MSAIQERNQDATVYCGNVDDKVSESLLWELFLQAGPVVNVHMPKDRITQNHQGYGFIEFMSEEDADYAIKIMNMIKVYGKPIRVNKASAHNKNLDVGANIFIGNLDPDIDEKLLYDTFSAFGVILQTPKIMRDPETGNSKGYAFINFASFEASDAAIDAMNGQYLSNRPISVSYSFKKDAKGERHGSAAERLLAANNPLTQTDRPHQLFADAPPSIPINIGSESIGSAPVLPPPIVPPPMGIAPPLGMGSALGMMPPPNRLTAPGNDQTLPPLPPPMGIAQQMGINIPPEQKIAPQFPPNIPPTFMSGPPALPGMPAFHRMNFPSNVPPPGFPHSLSTSLSENNKQPASLSSETINVQSNNQLPVPIPPPMSNDTSLMPGSIVSNSHGPPPRPPFGLMGFGSRGQWGPPRGPPMGLDPRDIVSSSSAQSSDNDVQSNQIQLHVPQMTNDGPILPPPGPIGNRPPRPPFGMLGFASQGHWDQPRGLPPGRMGFDPRDIPPPHPPPMPIPRPPPS